MRPSTMCMHAVSGQSKYCMGGRRSLKNERQREEKESGKQQTINHARGVGARVIGLSRRGRRQLTQVRRVCVDGGERRWRTTRKQN
jgi:hypothetical protein